MGHFKAATERLTCNQNAAESNQLRSVHSGAKVADHRVQKESADVVADQDDGGHPGRKRISLLDGA